ncbi:MAG: serine hydrolase [Planctomycetes bacterium]|nr:serine hydrolase [Planctomycetota bacterium]
MPAPRTPLPLVPLWLLPAVACAQTGRPPIDPAMLQVGAAYAAKVAASAVFVSGRSIESVKAEEFAPVTELDKVLAPLLRFEVDRENRKVTAILPLVRATALATDGLGCVLAMPGCDPDELRARAPAPPAARGDGEPAAAADPETTDWPLGERLPPLPQDLGIDRAAVERALDAAFAETDPDRPRVTRAIGVVYRGRLVAERYRAGYDRHTLLPGWSMTKTLLGALVGMRVADGALDLDAPLDVPEWPVDDPRRVLRLPDLLAMQSGLQWSESYTDPGGVALRMLFLSPDHAAVQAEQPIVAPAGERFVYSSGTTNLVSRILRGTFASDAEYWAYPRDRLFAPLGIHRGLIEADPNGTLVGSSYGFLTARDWARIGMLFADDGAFAGRQVVPAEWIRRSATPGPASAGRFGYHLWLNVDPDGDGPKPRNWPELPTDLRHLDGHEGQFVFALPSEQLVIARLGCTKASGSGVTALVQQVLGAIDR